MFFLLPKKKFFWSEFSIEMSWGRVGVMFDTKIQEERNPLPLFAINNFQIFPLFFSFSTRYFTKIVFVYPIFKSCFTNNHR
jgi:hypothetical protein